MTHPQKSSARSIGLLLTTVLVLAATPAGAQFNPETNFFVSGNLVGDRNIQLGDPQNWNVALDALSGSTDSGKLTVQPTSYVSDGDALLATWDKQKTKGQLAIYGPTVDLSSYEDNAALVFEINISRLSSKPILLGMDCHWPCRSEFDVRRNLRDYPKNEWATFAVPLNCFTLNGDAEEFDIARVNGPFLLSTEGRMEIAIANIRIALLPEGDPGCR